MKGWHIEKLFQKEKQLVKQMHEKKPHDEEKVCVKNRAFNLNISRVTGKETLIKTSSAKKKLNKTVIKQIHYANQQSLFGSGLKEKEQLALRNKDVPLVDESVFSYKGQILVSFILLLLGLACLVLLFVSLANALGLAVLFFLGGILLIGVAGRMSHDYIEEINAKKWDYKKWPFKLVISVAIVIFSLIIAAIFGAVYSLSFVEPNSARVALFTAFALMVSLLIGFLFMPD